ncbi:MAG: hypothetical protein CL961_05305 [Euryarchaeota archaeon]|nr:hypothetical protein [Euryarchaeota archaeon]
MLHHNSPSIRQFHQI